MGFEKYHEDNIEMWEERNRYRRFPEANMDSHRLGTSVQNNIGAHASGLGIKTTETKSLPTVRSAQSATQQ